MVGARDRLPSAVRGVPAFDCGDLAYDDGVAENSIFFGGGQAGEPDHVLGGRFELADSDPAPGRVLLTGFCISNSIDLTGVGRPWPNEVLVYSDLEGVPDLAGPQRRATVRTGDGAGQVEVIFDEAWPIDEAVFWIVVQGDPLHAGEDFNLESDQSSEPAGRSWIADRGVTFMVPTAQNFMIRASVEVLPGRSVAVPAVGIGGLMLPVLATLGVVSGGRRLDARASR